MTGRRKRMTGVVVSDKMNKTVVVAVAALRLHRLYKKAARRTKHYKVHDEAKSCRVGDRVVIEQTRPLSKEKRWQVAAILARGALVEELLAAEIEPPVAVPPPTPPAAVASTAIDEALEPGESSPDQAEQP